MKSHAELLAEIAALELQVRNLANLSHAQSILIEAMLGNEAACLFISPPVTDVIQ